MFHARTGLMRACAHAGLLTLFLSWAAPDVAAASGPKPPGQSAQEQEEEQTDVLEALGDFEDFDDLNLGDLLSATVSIAAAGRIDSLEEAPGIVSVISKEEIRRLGARTLEDILELVPGFEVLLDGLGRGRIVVRGLGTGASSENVLMLFNGQRLNTDYQGGATATNLDIPADNIEKVEIIRGPGSALFGANAFLAVINVVTQSHDTFTGLELSTGAGPWGTTELKALFGRYLGALGVSGFVQWASTDSAPTRVVADNQTVYDAAIAPHGIESLSLAPGTTFSDRRSLDANFQIGFKGFSFQGRYKRENSGGFVGQIDVLRPGTDIDAGHLLGNLTYRGSLGRSIAIQADAFYTQTRQLQDLDILPPGFATPVATSFSPKPIVFPLSKGVRIDTHVKMRRYGGEVRGTITASDTNQLVLGAGYAVERPYDIRIFGNVRFLEEPLFGNPNLVIFPVPAFTELPSFIPEEPRRIFSLYAQDTWDVASRVTLTAGIRWDRYSDFGSTVNPRAALVWRLPANLSFKLLYGRAFRAPSIYELFVQVPGLFGNPDLEPAITNTFDAALIYRDGPVRLSINAFVSRIDNLILQENTRLTATEPISGSFQNVPGVNIDGFELEARRDWGFQHSVWLNYTLQNPTNRVTGEPLPGVPRHLVNLGGTLDLSTHLSLTSTLQLRSTRSRARDNARDPVGSYALANATLRLRNLIRGVELSIAGRNLFDVRYADPALRGFLPEHYPRPGRHVISELSYLF